MLKVRIWILLVLCLFVASSAMANVIAIDEDFDSGVAFTDLGFSETSMTASTVQGVNITASIDLFNPTYGGVVGLPITYSDDPTKGKITDIETGKKCYELYAGKSLQFGTMEVPENYVNGHIPNWGDGNTLVQAALAVGTSALSAANGTVVGKMEIAFDTTSLIDGQAANLKIQKYELRVDSANNQIDVYAIDKDANAVKVLDGLTGNNWANITTAIFVRGAATDGANQWGDNGAFLGIEQKGPAAGTEMANADEGGARCTAFVNSNDPATAWAWTGSGVDGRPDTLGHNDAGIMGIKFTAGTAGSLYIDNVLCTSEQLSATTAGRLTPDVDEPGTNVCSRLNAFTAPVQGVPTGVPPTPGPAAARAWELY